MDGLIGFFLGAALAILLLIPAVDSELSAGEIETPWGTYICYPEQTNETD